LQFSGNSSGLLRNAHSNGMSSGRNSSMPNLHVPALANNEEPPMLNAAVRRSLAPDGKTESGRKGRLGYFYGIVILVIAIGVGLTITLLFNGKKEQDLPIVRDTSAPTGSPTPAPSASPTSLERFMEFLELMEPVSGRQALEEINTPQRNALEWLAHRDPANLRPSASNVEGLRERYLAALVYFSLHGQRDWFKSLGFLSGSSICSWNSGLEGIGIACEDGSFVTTIKLGMSSLCASLVCRGSPHQPLALRSQRRKI
jgi:hypothetical protein